MKKEDIPQELRGAIDAIFSSDRSPYFVLGFYGDGFGQWAEPPKTQPDLPVLTRVEQLYEYFADAIVALSEEREELGEEEAERLMDGATFFLIMLREIRRRFPEIEKGISRQNVIN